MQGWQSPVKCASLRGWYLRVARVQIPSPAHIGIGDTEEKYQFEDMAYGEESLRGG